ncbi:MAG: hypothetical protein IJY69_06805 [Clostridia bacterium]|nr:hypothetical protein [Clostridia bacterium]
MKKTYGMRYDEARRIIIENRHLIMRINENAICESLILKSNDRELIDKSILCPIFSLTEKRPYNNEIKLMHPNKRTTFAAKNASLTDGKLTVYFDLVTFGAEIEVDISDEYVLFRLGEFIITDDDFRIGPTSTDKLNMDIPPVDEFRLIALPVKRLKHFGEWLNVTWDEGAAVAVVAAMPETRIDHEKSGDGLLLTADAVRGIKLIDCSAALIVTEGQESMLDALDALEENLGLPRGVKSRRSGLLNSGSVWTGNATLENIDEIIDVAKMAGAKSILFYYKCFFKEELGYKFCGNYEYRDTYPNGAEDVSELLRRVTDAGLIPGLHSLHTHIGICTKYVTPIADHRLHLTRHFTLSKPLDAESTTVYVEQSTADAPLQKDCRVLQFGGELISYEGYTDEYPYAFYGCKRGHFGTNVTSHPLGQIGGTLDISEFGATSVYPDQNSSLQDEIAKKIADIYNLGFRYCYFDGSEGANDPFDYHVSNAQYRVLKQLNPAPLYCEGAAKTHFGWHWMSGGNAFDIFPSETFKKQIMEFPFIEALQMCDDFTRVNFGWWDYFPQTEPDIYEFGTSRAASFDCPITMIANLPVLRSNPRTKDNLEVLRRWEEYRQVLTDKEKLMLRSPDTEHTLLKTDVGYKLVEYERVKTPSDITAYVFEYEGRSYATLWHKTGECSLTLGLCGEDISYKDEFVGNELPIKKESNTITVSVSDKAYLSAGDRDKLIEALEGCKINQ